LAAATMVFHTLQFIFYITNKQTNPVASILQLIYTDCSTVEDGELVPTI
jgi:hypothetical protein